MGKIIDMTAREAPVRWVIEVGDCEDYFHCRYIGESISGAHWRVFIQASTIDRVQGLLEKAKEQLNRSKAVIRTG